MDIYSRIELSKRADNKIKHDFSSINNIKWVKSFEYVDEVRDTNILCNFELNKNFKSLII